MPALVRTKYESDGLDVHAMRITPASSAAIDAPANEPAGAVNSPIKVKISKGKREFGISPRGVTISKTFGVAPDTFQRTAFLPVLTAAAFASAAYALNAVITYKGIAGWLVVGRRSEDY